jgi:hypothetical protein
VKARKQVLDEKNSLVDDVPTEDIAIKVDKEPELINQIVKKRWERLGPFVYQNPELPEIKKLRWLKPYVFIYYYINKQFENGAIYLG